MRKPNLIYENDGYHYLHGEQAIDVPFTIKDVFDAEDVRTTRGSRILGRRMPDAGATAVRRLKEAGGILIGKTNPPEFALRAETNNLLFGRTVNSWKENLTPDGSRGGEATVIAASLSPLGVGSDLGGSNRLPSHYCGTVGLKATHGRVPLTGHWPELLVRHMHAGPLDHSMGDVAVALSVMSGPDRVNPYAPPVPPAQLAPLNAPISTERPMGADGVLEQGWRVAGSGGPTPAIRTEVW